LREIKGKYGSAGGKMERKEGVKGKYTIAMKRDGNGDATEA